MDNNSKVMVCDKCLRASCWHDEFRCDEAYGAGLVIKTVGELRKLGLEHEDNWSDKKMIQVYGDANRTFHP